MAPKKSELIVVANRLPVRRARGQWITSPGGLVAALAPVMVERKQSAWVGWAGTVGKPPDPFVHDGIRLYPVRLNRPEYEGFYEGFSNGTLWPLYHDAIATPEYHRTWWDAYVRINERFANATAQVASSGATVWVQDYQLQLVPGMLRNMRPDLRIGFFLHIPFPARELFIRLPWRSQVIDGLLGADLIGFQTPLGAHNFRRAASRLADLTVSGKSLHYRDRVVRATDYPIGIDVSRIDQAAGEHDILARSTEIRESLGAPDTVLLGVDRLDYTKGIEARLRAFRELLDEERLSAETCVMIQIAEPSRSNVGGYVELRASVERLVGDINGNFGSMGRPAIHYLHQSQPFHELVAMYRAADVMLVTPLRDGMNLVAKEYVASRLADTGVLVLSEFAGASNELRDALLVNPHDVEGMKEAIETGVNLPVEEMTRRMRSMRRAVRRNDAHTWALRFLDGLDTP